MNSYDQRDEYRDTELNSSAGKVSGIFFLHDFKFLSLFVSSFYGYFTKGGALEVGVSSTKAVVYSSVVLLIFNFILTKLLLA